MINLRLVLSLRRAGSFLLVFAFVCLPPSACKSRRDRSDLNLINGAEAGGQYPAVVGYSIKKTKDTDYCTGTFVSSTTMITAVHCLRDQGDLGGGPLKSTVTLEAGGIAATGGYLPDSSNQTNFPDVAVVFFPEGTGKDPASITSRAAHQGEDVIQVGFGCPEPGQVTEGPGIKRLGSNTISSFNSILSHSAERISTKLFS